MIFLDFIFCNFFWVFFFYMLGYYRIHLHLGTLAGDILLHMFLLLLLCQGPHLDPEAELHDGGVGALGEEGVAQDGGARPGRVLAPPDPGDLGVGSPVAGGLDHGSHHLQPAPPGVAHRRLQHRLGKRRLQKQYQIQQVRDGRKDLTEPMPIPRRASSSTIACPG
jgi:hypothetical protein